MKVAALIARGLLGVLFIMFGANKWLHFVAVPMPGGDAGVYYSLLFRHHVMAVVAAFEVAGGLLLVCGRYVALGLVLLAPVLVNILIFHLLFHPSRIILAIAAVCLEAFLLVVYRHSFAGILQARTEIP